MSFIKNHINRDSLSQFARFALVGGFATLLHYGIYWALIHLFKFEGECWINLSYSIGYVVAWFCNFYLSAHFTFQSRTSVKRGIGFAVSHGINYVLHILFLNLFLWLGLSETWAPVPVFCIVIPINFILVRYVFRSKYFEN